MHEERRPSQTRGIRRGESLCTLPACCGRLLTPERSRGAIARFDTGVSAESCKRTSENPPSVHAGNNRGKLHRFRRWHTLAACKPPPPSTQPSGRLP